MLFVENVVAALLPKGKSFLGLIPGHSARKPKYFVMCWPPSRYYIHIGTVHRIFMTKPMLPEISIFAKVKLWVVKEITMRTIFLTNLKKNLLFQKPQCIEANENCAPFVQDYGYP